MGLKHNLVAAAAHLQPASRCLPRSLPHLLGVFKRFTALDAIMALAILGLALAFGFVALRAGTHANQSNRPVFHESYMLVGSRELTVAIVPLQPSAEVLAVVRAENSARSDAAAAMIDAKGLQALGADLAQLYPFTYTVLDPVTIPDGYFDFERKQYRIDHILDWLVDRHSERHYRTLGVLPVDVYEPGYNYLFGLAKLYGPACVSSSARMASLLPFARSTPEQRWHGIVRHEFGHALGLAHTSARSVMRYSDSLIGLDGESRELTAAEWDRLRMLHPVKWETGK